MTEHRASLEQVEVSDKAGETGFLLSLVPLQCQFRIRPKAPDSLPLLMAQLAECLASEN